MSRDPYLVTARKYRPQRFSDLVSQRHVAETLRNAIRLDRLAHAYLFSGPRGVGKTTVARILAQTINCTTPLQERDAGEACGICESCLSFRQGKSLNIIEIDAASHNKVEDARALIEKVRIPPQGAFRKVYIIDEVHMLTSQAFNALLKTLEEPPPHILFIFATTEPQKVLTTILSRCQRFDFHRISVSETVNRLREICEMESIQADDDSLMLIARRSDGALRDALSVFDQSVALCGTKLEYSELAGALGVVDFDLYFEVTSVISRSNSAAILQVVEKLVRSGYDFAEFLSGLSEHIRNLLVIVSTGSVELIEATDATRDRYQQAASGYAEEDLLHILMVLDQADQSLRFATQPRLKLELTLLKLVHMPSVTDLGELIRKLDAREQGPVVSQKTTSASSATFSKAEPVPNPVKPSGPASGHKSPESQGKLPAEGSRPASRKPEKPVSAPENSDHSSLAPPKAAITPESGNHEPVMRLAAVSVNRSNPLGEPALKTRPVHGDAGRIPSPGPTSGAGTASPDAAVVETDIRLQHIEKIWPAFVQEVMTSRIHVGSLLQHGSPHGISRNVLAIAVPDDFHVRLLNNQRGFLESHLAEIMNEVTLRLRFVVDDSLEVGTTTETEDEIDPLEEMNRLRQENPIVRAIIEQFGGELVW